MIETLTWKGLTFNVKPFTLDTLYSLWEGSGDAVQSGRTIRGVFENACKSLLIGTTKEAQGMLISGALAKSVLESEDVQAAMEFKDRVVFFSNEFTSRGIALQESAPDLKDQINRKAQKSFRPKSRKGTNGEQGPST